MMASVTVSQPGSFFPKEKRGLGIFLILTVLLLAFLMTELDYVEGSDYC
jgi:hypothetical protein